MKRTKTKALLALSTLLAGYSYAANIPVTGLTDRTSNADWSVYGNRDAADYSVVPKTISISSTDMFSPQAFVDSLLMNIVVNVQPDLVYVSVNGIEITYTYGPSGPNVVITFPDTPAPPVPVPAAAWLLGSGLVGLACIGRRTRRGMVAAEA